MTLQERKAQIEQQFDEKKSLLIQYEKASNQIREEITRLQGAYRLIEEMEQEQEETQQEGT